MRARRQPTLLKKIIYSRIAGDFTKGKSSKARAGVFLRQAELWGQSAGHKALRFVKGSIWASINNNDQVNLLHLRYSCLPVCSWGCFRRWPKASLTDPALWGGHA